jgi:hypothetical protein
MTITTRRRPHAASSAAVPGFPILMRLPDLRDGEEVVPTLHRGPATAEPTPVEQPLAATTEPPKQVSAKIAPPPLEENPSVVPTPTPRTREDFRAETESEPPTEATDEALGVAPPAALRRQRALERQRRVEEETTPRSWWTSHAPMIAGGFLAALVLTVLIARSNREPPTPEHIAELEANLPVLDIESGAGEFDAAIAWPVTNDPTHRETIAAKTPIDDGFVDHSAQSPNSATRNHEQAADFRGDTADDPFLLSPPLTRNPRAGEDAPLYPTTDPQSYRDAAPYTARTNSPSIPAVPLETSGDAYPATPYPTTSAPQTWR